MSSWYESSLFFTLRIREEEDIAGFLMNHASNRTTKKRKDALAWKNELSWRFPRNLGEIVDRFKLELPAVDQVIHNHTKFRIWRPFVDEQQATEMYESYVGGAEASKRQAFGAQMRMKGDVKFCPACVENDYSDHGYSIWRLGHLMPGVLACTAHQGLLATFCDYCDSRYSQNVPASQPTVRCYCGGSLKTVARPEDIDMGVSIDIATMVDDLLHEKAPRLLTAKNLSAAIRSHLGQGSGEGLRRRLHDALCSTVGEKTVEQMNISAVTLDRFVGKRAHMRPISNPIQSLLVIRALFGGWEGLERAMDLTDPDEVLGRPRLLFKRGERNVQALRRKRYSEFYHSLPEPEALALRNKYRQWLRDILDQDATLARKDLPKFAGYYSATNHLMSIDGDWFETMLPNRIARKSGPRFLEDETKKMQVAERVEQVIANIFARRDLAIETNPLSRITKSYLISAVGSIYENRGVKDDPDVEKALNDCIDTYESLRTRITLDIVKRVRVRDSRHRWADESWWFPHSRVAFSSHATRARRWLRKAE